MSSTFTYTTFHVTPDGRSASFEYTLQAPDGSEHHLREQLVFPTPLLNTPEQSRSLRALHLALGVSYYKIFLSDAMVHPYAMDQAEAGFWNDVWQNGLGEFLYVNKLPIERLAQFKAQAGQTLGDESVDLNHQGAMLGIGGGKDSIVAGELLKDIGVPLSGFVMATGEQRGQAADVADVMRVPLAAVERTLDKQLLQLQEQPGAYKGHVPISLIFGLVGTALAIASQATYVVVANEASASIPRISWNGRAVNHQWSKSFGFEQRMQQYVHHNITPAVTYFSAIRQLTSIGVAKLFVQLPQYFEVFTSDNSVFRIDPSKRPNGRWSLESPKSLSSYLLLAPWLPDSELERIFSINFMDQASLAPLFLALTGAEGEPPLDCVGTVEELELSVNLLAAAERFSDSALMRLARERGVVHDANWSTTQRNLLRLQPEQALPEVLAGAITGYLQDGVSA